MAGKPPQSNQPTGQPAKRPAINISTNFDEPSRAQRTRAAAAADKSGALPTTRSNVIVWSVVALVIGLPILVVIWLVAMPDNDEDRYPKAKVIEARREMALIATKAQLSYRAAPDKIPKNPNALTFAVTQADLGGGYDITYQMIYDKQSGVLTVFAPSIFADPPSELIMVVNLGTGDFSFNREVPK